MNKYTENQIKRAYKDLMGDEADEEFLIALLIILNEIKNEDEKI